MDHLSLLLALSEIFLVVVLKTYNGHISNKDSTAIPRPIPDLMWEPSGPEYHRVLQDTSSNKAFIKPEM